MYVICPCTHPPFSFLGEETEARRSQKQTDTLYLGSRSMIKEVLFVMYNSAPQNNMPSFVSPKSCFHRAIFSFSPPSSHIISSVSLAPSLQVCITNGQECGKDLIALRGQKNRRYRAKARILFRRQQGCGKGCKHTLYKGLLCHIYITLTSVMGTQQVLNKQVLDLGASTMCQILSS